MVMAALSRTPWLTYAALVAGGGAWMSVMSTYNTATQTSVPPWVRARATAMHTLCALGSFAIGSAFWGALSDIIGLSPALLAGALVQVVGPTGDDEALHVARRVAQVAIDAPEGRAVAAARAAQQAHVVQEEIGRAHV